MNQVRWEVVDPNTLEIAATVSETGEVTSDDARLAVWLRKRLSKTTQDRWSEERNDGHKIFEFSKTVYPGTLIHTDIVMFDLWVDTDYLLRMVGGHGEEMYEVAPTAWERAKQSLNLEVSVLIIDRDFVHKWSNVYDERFKGGKAINEEIAIREWLSFQKEPRYLDKEYFVRLGNWKSARARKHYESNRNEEVIDITRKSYIATDELEKLKLLMTLKGVGVPVASTILNYMQPDKFPIFDYHCRNVLTEAGLWMKVGNDANNKAWLDYVYIMRELANKLGVSLRELDKAMFAYDKREIYLS
ncbi:hypothetical protein ACFLWF_01645 [Chloroflexota bacterium]